MPFWSWDNSAAIPTWPVPAPATSVTATSTVWLTVGTATVLPWQTVQTSATTTSSLYQQQARQAVYWTDQTDTATQAYQRYQFGYERRNSLGQLLAPLLVPCAPSIITRESEQARDQELYRRAMGEHDEQEAARLLRQIEAREVTLEGQRRLREEQRQAELERVQQRDAAKLRARELLFEHLTPQQRDTFDANGWFIVQGGQSKTRYRIRAAESMAGNVDVLSPVDQRHATHRLCAHVPIGMVPLGDQLLAQKIMLELAEDEFLRTANRHAA